MIKLEKNTWYYLYTDGEDYYISSESPKRDEDKQWYHDGRRCLTDLTFRVGDPHEEKHIQDFYDVTITP